MADTSEKKTCFVITPIGDDPSPTRQNMEKLIKGIIKPALEKCGYGEPEIAHSIDEPGFITDQVIERLKDSDLVIADLTDHNPNVFYELAIRHAFKKPFIHVITKGQSIPFDAYGIRAIEYDFDFESVPNLIEQLARQIESADKYPGKINNPISMALDFSNVAQTDGAAERLVTAYMPLISEVFRRLERIENRLPPTPSPHGGSLQFGYNPPPQADTTLLQALRGSAPTDVSGGSATGENPPEKEK